MKKYRVWAINLMIATAISLIVNFSYFVFSVMSNGQIAAAGRRMAQHAVPEVKGFVAIQVVYFIIFALVLLTILTYKSRRQSFMKRLVLCVVVSVVFYMLTPTVNRHGDIMLNFATNRVFNPMLVLKVVFTLIVSVLYGKIYELLYQRQEIVLENEKLKNESLKAQYNTLVHQINPHFFFNSMNSLSMLVRQSETDKAIKYIDQLSDTFRYIIQNVESGMATVKEELQFVEAYKYLMEIRYADKLFADISIPEQYLNYSLPTLSLQPLIENAINHNSITHSKPFHISISAQGKYLVVSNPLIPKLNAHDGTGIGLNNLSSRYRLMMGRDIEIIHSHDKFEVRLPLNAEH